MTIPPFLNKFVDLSILHLDLYEVPIPRVKLCGTPSVKQTAEAAGALIVLADALQGQGEADVALGSRAGQGHSQETTTGKISLENQRVRY